MMSTHKYSLRALAGVVFTMLLTAVTVTACGKDEQGGGNTANRVQWDPVTTVKPTSSGFVVMLISGKPGTRWTAEVVSGNWISFAPQGSITTLSGEVGTTWQSNEKPVYYTANTTNQDRHAQVAFTFEGEAPVLLDLVQYSISEGEDVYELRRNEAWPEIPSFKSNSNFTYVTHLAEFTNESYMARNYTLCFDKTKRAAWWVAYPLHSVHTGSFPRPKPDPWAYDPKLPSEYQANLASGSYNGPYDRGHQLPNADRNGNQEMQYQTFYCSNATPQNSTLNQQPWARLEGKVRGWICSDTLYVVTGAYWNASGTTSTTDKSNQDCPIPDYYFKVVVRTVKGNIRQKGDLLGSYSASQLQSIGFWVKNATGQGEAVNWTKSVSEIEALTGFSFFPSVDPSVKQQKNPGAWGL